jgi:hypothetical protein
MKAINIILLVLFLFTSVCRPVFAQQKSDYLSGNISVSELSGSYIVSGDCFFSDSCYIHPGTEFLFDGEYQFVVNDDIVFDGSAELNIVFKSYNGLRWDGIKIDGNQNSDVIFRFCSFEDADYPIYTSQNNTSNILEISSSAFSGVKGGVKNGSGDIYIISNCTFIVKNEQENFAVKNKNGESSKDILLENNHFYFDPGDDGLFEAVFPNYLVQLQGDYHDIRFVNNSFDSLYCTAVKLTEINGEACYFENNQFIGIPESKRLSIDLSNPLDYRNVAVLVNSNEGIQDFSFSNNSFVHLVNPYTPENIPSLNNQFSAVTFKDSNVSADILLSSNTFDSCGYAGGFNNGTSDFENITGAVLIDYCNELIIDNLQVQNTIGRSAGFLNCQDVAVFSMENSHISGADGDYVFTNSDFDPVGFARVAVRESFMVSECDFFNANNKFISGNFEVNLTGEAYEMLKISDCHFENIRTIQTSGGAFRFYTLHNEEMTLNEFLIQNNDITGNYFSDITKCPDNGGFVSLNLPNSNIERFNISLNKVNEDLSDTLRANANGGFASIISKKIGSVADGVIIENNQFFNVLANQGNGGVFLIESESIESDFSIMNNTFTGCSADAGEDGEGGVLSLNVISHEGDILLSGNTFVDCFAGNNGGVLNFIAETYSGSFSVTGNSGNTQSFTSCRAENGHGGALFVSCQNMQGSLLVNGENIDNQVFDDCTAPSGSGGAIYVQGSIDSYTDSVFVVGNTINNCHAGDGNGGFLSLNSNSSNNIIILSQQITGCQASGNGGAFFFDIDNIDGDITIAGESIQQSFVTCNAGQNGGAIYIQGEGAADKQISLIKNEIQGVVAENGMGGWLYCNLTTPGSSGSISNLNIEDFITEESSTGEKNQSSGDGGLIYLKIDSLNAPLQLLNNQISDCESATGNGGAIFLESVALGDIMIFDNKIENCASGEDGGAFLFRANMLSGTINISNDEDTQMFSDCYAGGNGGAIDFDCQIHSTENPVTISNNSIINCSAAGKGGWLNASNNQNAVINGLAVTKNNVSGSDGLSAGLSGGFINLEVADITDDITFSENYFMGLTSGADGGAVSILGASLESINVTNNQVIENCEAGGNGGFLAISSDFINGGIAIQGNQDNIQRFVSNESFGHGGSIYINSTLASPEIPLEIFQNSISGGGATGVNSSGGWLCLNLSPENSDTEIVSVEISNNEILAEATGNNLTANNHGGAILLDIDRIIQGIDINNNSISNVSAENGNGGFIALTLKESGGLNVSGNNIALSSAGNDGGFLYLRSEEGVIGDIYFANSEDRQQSFNQCTAGNHGGVFYLDSPSLTGTFSVGGEAQTKQIFSGCEAGINGGSIFIDAAWELSGTDLIFNYNQVSNGKANGGSGGWLYLVNRDATKRSPVNNMNISDNIISGMRAGAQGGFLYSELPSIDQEFVISNNNISDCISENDGGAFAIGCNAINELSILDNIFEKGESRSGHGGVFAFLNPATQYGSIILNQNKLNAGGTNITRTNQNGGFLYLQGAMISSAIEITDNEFLNALADGSGGVFSFNLNEASGISITGNKVINNTAENGGFLDLAVQELFSGDVVLSDPESAQVFEDCEALNDGGVIHLQLPVFEGSVLMQQDMNPDIAEYHNCSAGGFGGVTFLETEQMESFYITENLFSIVRAGTGGGVYLNAGQMNLFSVNNSIVNTAFAENGSGGLIYASVFQGNQLVAEENQFMGCYASLTGGVIAIGGAFSETVLMSDNEVSDCYSGFAGGAYSFGSQETGFSGDLNISTDSFTNVYSWSDDENSGFGGAVSIFGTENSNNMSVSGCDFAISNTALKSYSGGALYAHNINEFEVTDSKFESLKAANDGGSIYLTMVNNVILSRDTVIYSGSENGSGGALFAYSGNSLSIDGSMVSFSNAGVHGGAVRVDAFQDISVGANESNSFFYNTSQSNGAALYFKNPSATLEIEGNVFSHNGNNEIGGGVFIYNPDNSFASGIKENYFLFNDSEFNGAAIAYVNDNTGGAGSEISSTDNVFLMNKLFDDASSGGAVYLSGNSGDMMTSLENRYLGNYAGKDGGAIRISGMDYTGTKDIYVENNLGDSVNLDRQGMAVYSEVTGDAQFRIFNNAIYRSDDFGNFKQRYNLFIDNSNSSLPQNSLIQNSTFYNLFNGVSVSENGIPESVEVNSVLFYHYDIAKNREIDHFGAPVVVNYSFTQRQNDFAPQSQGNITEYGDPDIIPGTFILDETSRCLNTGDPAIEDLVIMTGTESDVMCDIGVSGGANNDFSGGAVSLKIPAPTDFMVDLQYNSETKEIFIANTSQTGIPEKGVWVITTPAKELFVTGNETTISLNGVNPDEFSCSYTGWFANDTVRASGTFVYTPVTIDSLSITVNDQNFMLLCDNIISIPEYEALVTFRPHLSVPDTIVNYRWEIESASNVVVNNIEGTEESILQCSEFDFDICDAIADSLFLRLELFTADGSNTPIADTTVAFYISKESLMRKQLSDLYIEENPEFFLLFEGTVGNIPDGTEPFDLFINGAEVNTFEVERSNQVFISDTCFTQFRFHSFDIDAQDLQISVSVNEDMIPRNIAYGEICPELFLPGMEFTLNLKPDGIGQYNFSAEIYPNPFDDQLLVKTSFEGKKTEITITDISGSVVYKEETEALMIKINTHSLAKGIYILTLRSDDFVESYKLIHK